ncbi:hypothetical protein F0562_017322 [Nyssa sinensis]|uniref:F-box domain-containing protein n=1 Tax=Nyssa sinensis TaxID=561372 RepID=A0A5J4ZEC7_9ASTE|nr:hypothetical protein F0562_017322 [Nyssa sinensis]
MSELPADVVTDILSRLPVETLLRFRCVSKPWCALIDSSDFIKFHLKRSIETKNNLSIVLGDVNGLYTINFEWLDEAVKLDSPIEFKDCEIEVSGSCNGLLCLSNIEQDIVLWNPSTRKCKKLPVAPIEFPRGFSILDTCPFIVYGFGHDVVNDEYKVVRMVQYYVQDNDSFDSEVKVYNLKSNSWRRIPDFPYYLCHDEVNGILAGGALHWVVRRKPKPATANLIAGFDIGTEEYRLVPQPEYENKKFLMNIGVLGECLCILCNYYLVGVDIWVMKEYGVKESWTKLFSVVQPSVTRSFWYVWPRPIAYSKSRREVLLALDYDGLFCLVPLGSNGGSDTRDFKEKEEEEEVTQQS